MANRKSIPNTKYGVDPLFPIPDGLEELFYLQRDGDYDPSYDRSVEGFEAVIIGEEEVEEEEEIGDDENLAIPTGFKVVKQDIRTKADGSQVVDITVEVNDVPGADKYEFRRADNG